MSDSLTLKVVSEDRESWYYFPGIRGEFKCSEGSGDYILREVGASGAEHEKTKSEIEVIDVSDLTTGSKFNKDIVEQKIKDFSYSDKPQVTSVVRTNKSTPPKTTVIFDNDMVNHHNEFILTNWLEYTDSDGVNRLIVFNTPAYLLNEKGQTIDKFNEVRC